MRRATNRLAHEIFDLLIVGGGATGACVARDAAMRGLSVALIDKGDFANATSAHNSKLVHGGLRYLRNFELGLVRESLKERRIWQRIALHLVHPLPFLIPLTDSSLANRAMLTAGMTLYDLLSFDRGWLSDPGQRLPGHSWLGREAALAREPVLEAPGFAGAFEYYDAQMYAPERLALECILDADAHGAAIANYVEAGTLLLRDGGVEGCHARDRVGGAVFDVRAKTVLVAAGPWADLFLAHATGKPAAHKLLRSKGIHLLTPPLTHDAALTIEAGAGHIFILPWRGHTLIGTTDTAFQGDPDSVGVSESDIADFLALINRYLPGAKLARGDVEYFYAGLRPLVDDGSGSTYNASRRAELIDHGAEDGVAGLFSALGGKWTTSRNLAETITDAVVKKLGKAARPCATATMPLPGGRMARFDEFEKGRAAVNPDLPSLRHLAHMYGTRLPGVLAAGDTGLLGPSGDIAAQIAFSVREEMAMTLADIVMRRTGIGQFGPPSAQTLRAAASLMAKEMDWDEARCASEIASLAPYYKAV
ncbi:MAG TPA: glycerol-3-phosphate dehydrogenase/oxidase [Rhizomicrobium sp.]